MLMMIVKITLLSLLVISLQEITGAASSPFPLPKEWKGHRLVSSPKLANHDTQQPIYLVQYMYKWGSTCQDESERTESSAFGACIGGVDEDGNPMTSWNSVFVSANSSMVNYISNTYKSPDCSGKPLYTYYVDQPLNDCQASSMYLVTDTANPTPWAGSNKGVVVKTYSLSNNDTDQCSGFPEVFQAISFDYCMGYQDPEYPTVTNLRYSQCDDESVTYIMYGNYTCDSSSAVKTVNFQSTTCRICPGEQSCYPQGFWYRNYESISCNA